MRELWTKEQAWAWYNSKPWIRGCNFMGSDCANRIERWQEHKFEEKLETADREFALMASIGFNSIRLILEFQVWDRQHDSFMEHLERYLETAHKYGISTMLVLSNELEVRGNTFEPAVFGEQPWLLGYHGGRKPVGIGHGDDCRYHFLDYPDAAGRYYCMVEEVISKYRNDERVLVWNLMNEPGNGRGSKSLKHLKKFFEIGRRIDPIQPLCADVWRGMVNGKATTEIEQYALDNSDIISYHCYENFEKSILHIQQIKSLGRPAMNTEWLNRCKGNNVMELFPLFYLENIGCYNWGFVAGKYQTSEPYAGIWDTFEKEGYDHPTSWDVTKWMHDLYRLGGRFPYDPKEIALIQRITAYADKTFNMRVEADEFV